jgi:NAD(P)H-dependent FMN reductase
MYKLILALSLLASSLTAEVKVLAIAGSTRADSYNKKLAKYAAEMAKDMGATVTLVDLKDYAIPFYDEDGEKTDGMPKNAKKIRDLMIESQAIIIASPEYNGSLSAVLKNVIDWASRDEKGQGSREAYKGKKFAIMSASPGQGGGVRGLAHLRTIIENIGGEVVKTEVAISNASSAFNKEGQLTNDEFNRNLKLEIQEVLK